MVIECWAGVHFSLSLGQNPGGKCKETFPIPVSTESLDI
jgi:hypothetical protein